MELFLGRIGDTKEALELIITELKDMQHAISFCQEHDDPDLWENLIDNCLEKPGKTLFHITDKLRYICGKEIKLASE